MGLFAGRGIYPGFYTHAHAHIGAGWSLSIGNGAPSKIDTQLITE